MESSEAHTEGGMFTKPSGVSGLPKAKAGRGPVALGGKEQRPDPPFLLLRFSRWRFAPGFTWLISLIHCCCENKAEHAVESHRNQRKLVMKTLTIS